MKKFVCMCGLPRTGSTLLVNVLNQNPQVTISPDSILGSLVYASQSHFTDTVRESQYDAETSYKLIGNFCRSGVNSWIETICDTDIYIDKCRSWSHELDFLFNLFPDIKIIYTIRDIRGIVSSIEKVHKKTMMNYKDEIYFGEQDYDFNKENLYKIRIKSLLDSSMIRKNLICLKEILDVRPEYLDRIKIIRYEDFILNPEETLDSIWSYIGERFYNHDLKNIKQVPYHDSIFLPYGNHRIKSKLEEFDPFDFSSIPEKIQENIMLDHSWYYEEFYEDQI
jgi:sulfotransferase